MNLLEIWNTGSKQVNRETKDLILIFHNDNPHSKNGYLISLPKRVKNSQVTSTYYISNDTLYECYRMPRFSPQVNKTWFFEEKVVSKANIFGLVKMDPFYIVLEIFTTFLCSETCKNDIIPICIKDLCKQFSEYPSLHNFFELQPVKNCLSSLLDFKSSKYSLNTFKVLFWLKTKFEHIYSNIVESSVLLERISVKKSIFPSVNVDGMLYTVYER